MFDAPESHPKTTFIYGLKDPRVGKIRYVGKSNDPRRRLMNHVAEARHARRRTYTFNWIRKLLREGVRPEIEVLEEVAYEDWPEREKHYIATLPDLVNGHPGGDAPVPRTGQKNSSEHCRRISESLKRRGWKPSKKQCEHLSKINTGPSSPRWGAKNSPEHRRKISEGRYKPVAQYHLTGSLFRWFRSAKDAQQITGISHGDISVCAHGKRQTAGGFVWRFFEKGTDPPRRIEVEIRNGRKDSWSTSPRAIDQLTLEGELVKTWPALNQAARTLGLDTGSLSKCVKGKAKTCGGFRWAYSDEEGSWVHAQPVVQLDEKGVLVECYPTLNEAARSTGTDRTGIHRCLDGKRKTAGGSRWLRAEDLATIQEAI